MEEKNKNKVKDISVIYILITIVIMLGINTILSKGNIMFALGGMVGVILLPLPLILFNQKRYYLIGMIVVFLINLYGQLAY